MSITDYVGRRIPIQITAQDRTTGEPSIVTGGIVVAAKRLDTIVAADVTVDGANIHALFDGTLTEPGTWYVQANEYTGATPDVIWSDTITTVLPVPISGITPVTPILPTETAIITMTAPAGGMSATSEATDTATLTLTAPASIMSATGTAIALPDAPTAAGTLADLTLTEGVEMTPVDVSGDFTSTVTLTYALAPSSAALPTGVSLSSSGVLSGTPTGTNSGVSIVIRATDTADQTVDSVFTFTVEAATAASATIADFSRDAVVYDGDMVNGVNEAVIPISGTATADEPIQARAVVSALDQDPVLFDGRTGSETPAQLRTLVKNNASKLFNRFAAPPMTLAEINAWCETQGPNVFYTASSNRIEVKNGAVVFMDNMNLGVVGLDVRQNSVVFGTNVESTRGIMARDQCWVYINGFKSDNQIAEIYNVSLPGVSAIVETFGSATLRMSDVCITRNECDTFKLTGNGGSTIIGCVAEPLHIEKDATEYDGATTYAVGDYVTFASDPEQNVYWRKQTDAAAGTAPTVGGSSADWLRGEPHYDFLQQFGESHGPVNFIGLYYNDQNTERLVGDTSSDYRSVVGTSVIFQMSSSAGDVSLRGCIINSTQLTWMRRDGLSSGTTTVVDCQIEDSSPFKNANRGAITAARIVDMAGNPLDVTSGTTIVVTDGSAEPTTDYAYISANHDFEYAHDWQTVGTASGGTWSGTITEPVRPLWYRLEARVQGSAEPSVKTANRAGVGMVLYNARASNGTRVFGARGSGRIPDLSGIGSNFQVTRLVDGLGSSPLWGGNPDNRVVRGPSVVTTAEPVTGALAAMAEVFHRNAPGLKVHILGDALAGKQLDTALKDSDTLRTFSRTQALFDSLEDGVEVGAFILDERQHAVGLESIENVLFGGLTVNGAVAPSNPDFDHIFADVMPGLVTGRTQVLIGGIGMYWPTTSYPSIDDIRREGARDFVAKYPTIGKTLMEYEISSRFDNPSDQTSGSNANHFVTYDPDGYGYELWGSGRAMGVMRAAGLFDFAIPTFDNVEVEPSGAHITVWSSAGPITTIERQQALAESRSPVNYPINPSNDPLFEDLSPGQREVLVGQFADFTMPTRVEIVDEAGNPAASGRVRMYPESGQTFNSGSRLFVGDGLLGANFPGLGGSNNMGFARDARTPRHLPIIDVGVRGHIVEYGAFVEPNPDRDWIVKAIGTELAPADYTLALNGPISPIAIGRSSTEGATFHFKVNPRNTVQRISIEVTGSQFHNFLIYSSSRIEFTQRYNGVSELFNYQPTNLSLAEDADGFIEMLVNVDATNRRFELYYRDPSTLAWVAHDPNNEWFDNTNWPAGINYMREDDWEAITLSSTSAQTYTDFIRIWKGSQGPLTAPPVTTPWFELVADPAGAFDAVNIGAAGSTGRFDVLDDGVARTP